MVDSARMLSFDDERWNNLTGGYKTPFDPRPSLRKLQSQQDAAASWQELWEELSQLEFETSNADNVLLCTSPVGFCFG
jgi:hypothetical protein